MPHAPGQLYMLNQPVISSQSNRYFACAVYTVQFGLNKNEIQIFTVKENESKCEAAFVRVCLYYLEGHCKIQNQVHLLQIKYTVIIIMRTNLWETKLETEMQTQHVAEEW